MLIIDIRTREEYNLSHIQTSLHLSLSSPPHQQEKEQEKGRDDNEEEEEEEEEDPREKDVFEKVGGEGKEGREGGEGVELCLQVKSMRKWERRRFCSAVLYDNCQVLLLLFLLLLLLLLLLFHYYYYSTTIHSYSINRKE